MVELGQVVSRRSPGDFDFLFFRRIIELDQKHEAIELRFGQRIRAFLYDWVLRGEHEKWCVEYEWFADRSDAALLHRFEHCRLSLWRSTVDLVGKDDVGEHRSVDKLKFAPAPCPILKNIRTGDVHRHQVWSELDAAELKRHRFR